MLIAEPSSAGGMRVIDGFSRIVRLGEGLGDSGSLCDDAICRAISALDVCAKKMRRHNVVKARYVATEACRQANNCTTFFEDVEAATGIRLEAIAADEEARLTLAGCEPLFDTGHSRAVLFDIGGGSTELSWVDVSEGTPARLDTISLPLGVLSLLEKHGPYDCADSSFDVLVQDVQQQLDAFGRRNGVSEAVARGDVLMLGTSGTVTTLAALHLGLSRYDRRRVDGMQLSMDDVNRLVGEVISINCADRSQLPCIGPERADLMVMGCAILAAITSTWPARLMRVADRGIREGLLLEMIQASESHGTHV